ncbi:MAG: DUF2637 domain-containing protein [Streptosporangiales bacterium]|nr:DUF2637 domain-containing protein [Streptosporangiales bacterium]
MTALARRAAAFVLDSGPVLVLAFIAGAGSFTHIRDTAAEHGQTGWLAWAIAVCVDLTCVMAARERQRDRRTGRPRRGLASWPTLVLVGGMLLSLAANLAQAEPTPWGWATAATPCAAFLVAVSMLERRAGLRTVRDTTRAVVPAEDETRVPVLASDGGDVPAEPSRPRPGPAPELVGYARRVAAEHQRAHGRPITRDALRARLGVSNQLASDLLQLIRTPATDTA